jgi:uroporphyrinogen-III synthase
MAPAETLDHHTEAAARGANPGSRASSQGTVSESAVPDGPRPDGGVADDVFQRFPLTGSVIAITADRRREELAGLLREQGARTVETPTVRLSSGDEAVVARRAGDRAAAVRFVEAVLRRDVHAVTFTSAPGVTGLLEAAAVSGSLDELLAALREDVLPVCLGPACARPLEAVGVAARCAEKPRFGSLVEALCQHLPPRIRREVRVDASRTLVLQGFTAVIGSHAVTLPPLPAAVLAELARRPGWVVSRAELLRRVWDGRDARGGAGRDEHAVEATVARLRTALGPAAGLVKTVTKRGYRLAVEP